MVDSPALVGTMNSICNKNEVFEIKLWLKTHKNEKKTRKIKIAKFSRNNAYTFRVFENEFESLFRSKAALKIENHTVTISKDNIILSSASLLLCLSPWNDDKKKHEKPLLSGAEWSNCLRVHILFGIGYIFGNWWLLLMARVKMNGWVEIGPSYLTPLVQFVQSIIDGNRTKFNKLCRTFNTVKKAV